jgi:hypothetical protein
MSGENWESLITEKGFMRVPRALRLKRAELGITNNEYTILLNYVDYYSFSGTMNPYRHLSEVSGMSERSIRNVLASLVKKGLLRRKVSLHGNGRTNGVVFSIDPLVRKLKTTMKKSSPTVGEENFTYVYEESFTPNTGEDLNKRDESKNTSAKNADGRKRSRDDVRVNEEGEEKIERGAEEMNYGFIRETGGPDQEALRNDRSGGKAGQIHLARAGPPWPELLSGNSGQVDKSPPSCPVSGISPLNRELINSPTSSEDTADSSLARNRPVKGEGINGEVTEESNASAGSARFIEKIREGHYASEQIERVYGELRGIESASRRWALPAGNRALRRKRG